MRPYNTLNCIYQILQKKFTLFGNKKILKISCLRSADSFISKIMLLWPARGFDFDMLALCQHKVLNEIDVTLSRLAQESSNKTHDAIILLTARF
jgi:hypothetical protein